MHPFPILNLKGKLVSKAHCGHDFVVCLGNNIRKEIPQLEDPQKIADASQHMAQQQEYAKSSQPVTEHKKKKTLKRKKNGE